MSASGYIRRGKHSGSVLAAALLLGLTAFSLSVLCLSVTRVTFSEIGALSDAIWRENAAREAIELSRAYFDSEMRQRIGRGETFDSSAATPSPIKEIPQSVFSAVTGGNPDITIEGIIIDQHYSASFANEARRLEIPEGRPSLLSAGEGASESVGKTFYARRYELRAKATFSRSPNKAYTMRQGLLALIETEGKGLKIVRLYMEK